MSRVGSSRSARKRYLANSSVAWAVEISPDNPEKQELARYQSIVFQEFFKKSKNPLFVWQILRMCLGAEIPIPEWVRAQLLTYADDLHSLSLKRTNVKDAQRALCDALGFFNPDPAACINSFAVFAEEGPLVHSYQQLRLRGATHSQAFRQMGITTEHARKKLQRVLASKGITSATYADKKGASV